MGCGYFGKLPMRGDFVSGGCPDGFLKIWEPFLNAGLARSRHDLKEAWEEAYMTMPVWKFCLEAGTGQGALATGVAGAFMPNVDRVGRAYPLTVVCEVAHRQETGGPASETDPGWFDHVEAALRSTLEDTASFKSFRADIARLGRPGGADGVSDRVQTRGGAPDRERGCAVFWSAARGHDHKRCFDGLPEASDFKWFLQPELFAEDTGLKVAGKDHGQSGEDLQT